MRCSSQEKRRSAETSVHGPKSREESAVGHSPAGTPTTTLRRASGRDDASFIIRVADLNVSIAQMTTAGGWLVVAPIPDLAFNERTIAFVYPGGQVTELIETLGKRFRRRAC